MKRFTEVSFKNFSGKKNVGFFCKSGAKNASLAIVLSSGKNDQHEEMVLGRLIKGAIDADFAVLRFVITEPFSDGKEIDLNIDKIIDDLSSSVDWAFTHSNAIDVQLNGLWFFSFGIGTYFGLNVVMRRPEIEGFIAVDGPYDKYSYNYFFPTPCKGLVISTIQEDQTSAASKKSGMEFAEALNEKGIFKVDFAECKVPDITSFVHNYLNFHVATKVNKPIRKRRRKRRKTENIFDE